VANKVDRAIPKRDSKKTADTTEPHVGRKRSVIVNTLKWRLVSAHKTPRIGVRYIDATADGVYVVVKLRVRNGKDESVTLSSSQITYEVAGKEYATDSNGTSTLGIVKDVETFLFKDLGPDVATKGMVVFDVPPATLKQKPEVCFGELGVGSTKGCIRLPRL
jgi:hypothetical protein